MQRRQLSARTGSTLRLSSEQTQSIVAATRAVAGVRAVVKPFGSGLDDQARGATSTCWWKCLTLWTKLPAWLHASRPACSGPWTTEKWTCCWCTPTPNLNPSTRSAAPRRVVEMSAVAHGHARGHGHGHGDRRLAFLLETVPLEAAHLLGTDERLFAQPFTSAPAAGLLTNALLAERLDAFTARFESRQAAIQVSLNARRCQPPRRPGLQTDLPASASAPRW